MKLCFNKPQLFFCAFGVIIFVVGSFLLDSNFGININDTYFVLSWVYLNTAIAALFMLIGLAYWICHRLKIRLTYNLNAAHILLTILGPLGYWLLRSIKELVFPVDNFTAYLANGEYNNYLGVAALIVLLIALLGQLVFPINLLLAAYNSKNS